MKRKIIKKLLFLLIVDLLFFIFGCKYHFQNFNNFENDICEQERKERLIEIALTGEWKSTEQEVQNAIITSLENNNRTAKANNIIINKINESSIPIKVKPNANRSALIDECEEVNFELYSIKIDDADLYVVSSDDKRIGNVLAIVESQFSNDISHDDFSIMFAERLNNYVLNTAEEWNSITERDITDYQARTANKEIVNSGKYVYSSWKKNSGNKKCQIPVNWNQNPSPYNTCLKAVKGEKGNYVGCGAIQVAQIMAFHKYQKSNKSPNLTLIKKKWSQAKKWNGKYDFSLLTSVKDPDIFSSENLRIQLGAFLFDVAEGCKSEYHSNGTTTYEKNRLEYLQSQGYTYTNTSDYSFSKIKASLNAGCPVPICGQSKKIVTTTTHQFLWWTWTTTNTSYSDGHAFIIDGYYNMTCTATNGKNKITITDNFVHCNPGWGGIGNGYYLSGVFNYNVGELVDDSGIRSVKGTDYYYQYKLSQTNMLKPAGK